MANDGDEREVLKNREGGERRGDCERGHAEASAGGGQTKDFKPPGTMADDVANDAAATAAASGSDPLPYDRWTLRNPSTVPYGYFSGSNNRCNESFWTSSSSSPSSSSSRPSTTSGKTEKGFYITTAINYTNGPAHMGHAYEGTTADVIARFARLNHRGGSSSGIGGGSEDEADDDDAKGESGDVGTRPYFVTGADEHGEKIAKTAEGEGRAPIDICNKVRVCVCIMNLHMSRSAVYSLEILAFCCNRVSFSTHPHQLPICY